MRDLEPDPELLPFESDFKSHLEEIDDIVAKINDPEAHLERLKAITTVEEDIQWLHNRYSILHGNDSAEAAYNDTFNSIFGIQPSELTPQSTCNFEKLKELQSRQDALAPLSEDKNLTNKLKNRINKAKADYETVLANLKQLFNEKQSNNIIL